MMTTVEGCATSSLNSDACLLLQPMMFRKQVWDLMTDAESKPVIINDGYYACKCQDKKEFCK